MTTVASLAAVAALIGDPARAAMLVGLMDGRALTAGELAATAGVAPPTASGHLGRMLDAGLLALERQGRHRYYRIADPEVAGLVEGLMSLAGGLGGVRPPAPRTGPRDVALRRARTCYDHLAGEVAVRIADAMIARGQLDFGADGGMLTDVGAGFLQSVGVELDPASVPAGGRRAFCRPCLDWSERRPHVAGAVGRAMLTSFLHAGWLRRTDSRVIAITPPGERALARHFGPVPC